MREIFSNMARKILLVDDNPVVQKQMARILEAEGHWVATASDGFEALNVLLSFVPDIMFVDWVMPKIGGDLLCRLVRRMPELKSCYLVIVSAALAEMDFDCQTVGADACIAKGPYNRLAADVLAAVGDAEKGGGPAAVQGTETLTARRITRELLARSRHLEGILACLPQGVLEIYSGHIVYANEAALRLLGKPLEDIIGASLIDAVHKTDRPRIRKLLSMDIANDFEIGRRTPLMINHRRLTIRKLPGKKDSAANIFLLTDVTEQARIEKQTQQDLENRSARHARDLQETDRRLQQEIAERKRVETALQDSENRFRDLTESLPDSIYEMDTDGRLTFFNAQACAAFGYSVEDIARGVCGFDLLALEDRPRIRADTRKILNGAPVGLTEYTARRKDGSQFPIMLHAAPAVRNGKTVGVRGVIIDISERKRTEQRLRRYQRVDAIRSMAGGIAHEFNNILSIILGHSELALTDADMLSGVRQNLEQIRTASLRAKDVVHQILTLTRWHPQNRKPIQIVLLVKEALKLMRSSIPRSVVIDLRMAAHNDTVMANPAQMHQVLVNLCTNAAQAMEHTGGRLDIRVDNMLLDAEGAARYSGLAAGLYLQVTVADSGCGIAPEIIERIFDPYFTTRQTAEGDGMGLAVVQSIVNNHGGVITVTSEAGRGTAFQILLPVHTRWAVPPTRRLDELPGGGGRILLVDDETALLDTVCGILTHQGYEVEPFSSGPDALARFEAQPDRFDLVITDQTMPRMTGIALARKLAALQPRIPMVLCTGHSDTVSAAEVRPIGIRKVITKPFTSAELIGALQEILHPSV